MKILKKIFIYTTEHQEETLIFCLGLFLIIFFIYKIITI